MNYEDLTAGVKIPEPTKHTWKYRDVMEYPDAARPARPYDPLRLRAIGVRDDGQILQAVGYISWLSLKSYPDTRERVEQVMLDYLDKMLNTKLTFAWSTDHL
jgi:hypothetical protein